MGRLMEIFRGQKQSDAVAAFRSLPVAPNVACGDELDTSLVEPRLAEGVRRLQARCPADVDIGRWRGAVQDAIAFVSRWGHHATLLGWTYDDVFGAAGYNVHRSSRSPAPVGLIWALDGRKVMAVTDNAAVSRSPSGRLLFFPRHRQLLRTSS
jgi:hypothetical protein